MTQELAKMLKDAGFPQKKGVGVSPYVPTLSELIAACDEKFGSLRRTTEGKWIASGHFATKDSVIPHYESAPYGGPDAAVAEVFLSMKSRGYNAGNRDK